MYGKLPPRLFGSALYRLTLGGRAPAPPHEPPPGLWPGDPERGADLVADFERSENQMPPPWSESAEAHGFDWLNDLKAAATPAARDAALRWTAAWIAANSNWRAETWRADILGRRLSNWLVNFDYLTSGSGAVAGGELLESLGPQARHLSRVAGRTEPGLVRFDALKGLVHCAVALPEFSRRLERALVILSGEIARQIHPDGGHVDRNPSTHQELLARLVEIRAALVHGRVEVPESLQGAIDRMAPMLRALRHGDGGLALFNGSREHDGAFADLILREASARGNPLSTAPHSGFHRIKAGRVLIIMEAGAIGDKGAAGTLSFEMSVGKHRMIVNCGTAPPEDVLWHDSLRTTAAHSTLAVEDTNSAELAGGFAIGQRRPRNLSFTRREIDKNILLEASHDGYEEPFGVVHKRSLYLAAEGDDVRGEDILSGPGSSNFAIRFHLHPSVQASAAEGGREVLIRLGNGQGWLFRFAEGELSVDDSVYFGSGRRRRTQQIVIAGRHQGPETVSKWRLNRAT